MKRKFPLFMAMLLTLSLLCSVAFAAPSPGRGEVEIDDPDVPLVELPTTPVEVEATVDESGAATVEVSASDLLAAVDAVNSEGTMRVTVTAKGADDASKVTAVLPKEALKAVAEQTSAGLQVDSAVGQVTLPNAVLASVVEAAGGDSVSVVVSAQTSAQAETLLSGKVDVDAAQIAAGSVVEVSITSGDSTITELSGGSATVTLPVGSGDFQEGMSYTVYQVAADGTVQALVGRCMMVNGQLRVVLTVSSLGTFVVLPETAADNTVAVNYDVVVSPLASRVAAEPEAPTLFASVQQWCDTAVKTILHLFGL